MSRIGRLPIIIPEGVSVEIKNNTVTVKGKTNTLEVDIRPEIDIFQEDNKLFSKIKIETKNSNAYWGLARSLISNMIKGVMTNYEKNLELVGVGYRVKEIPGGISMTVGYSHPVEVKSPEGIKFEVEENRLIKVSGSNKQLVGLTAAKIRKIKKPEAYKGKGIKYANEVLKLKPGKAGKV